MVKYAVIYNYNRNGKLKSNGKASVLIRAYLKSKNKFFNTGVYLKPDQWDDKNHRVKNHSNQFQLNRAIKDKLEALEAFEFEVIKRTGTISLERLGDHQKDDFNISFNDFFKQQLKQSTLKKQSLVDQQQSLNKLDSFNSRIFFSEIDFKFIKDFDAFLHRQKLSINTVAKHHKNLKKYLNLAIKYNYFSIDQQPYRQFKIKKEVTERSYLTEFELSQFEQASIPKENVARQQIKDFFLFCCYTGLRYSDASKITTKDLVNTDNGMELYFKAQKTGKPLSLPLSKLFGGKPEKLVKSYLEKYKVLYDNSEEPLPLFFGWSHQYINREIKEIVLKINIRDAVKQKISMHSSRHTFGFIMSGKIEAVILQKLMQHSRISETLIYMHLNEESINRELDKVKWEVNG